MSQPSCDVAGGNAPTTQRPGAVVGGVLGTFFGLAFGGGLPRGVADYVFEPEEPAGK
jgi:hypothetical protein